jgi:hypothetical protein
VTAERVKAHFRAIAKGAVLRYELPQIGALNFVLHEALGGGVTRSLALDAHGKGLSALLLDLEIPDRDGPDRDHDRPGDQPTTTGGHHDGREDRA